MIEIRFAGFGGQGIILMGIALARAATLYDIVKDENGEHHRFATQAQSYGPSARGGHSKCDVKISDEEIYYPFIEVPDILVLMSEPAYKKYSEDFETWGTMIVDSDLVKENPKCKLFRIPATKVAEEKLETRIVSNMVMLGAVQEITKVVSWDALVKAALEMVPKLTHELNLKALEEGRNLAKEAAGVCAPEEEKHE